MSYFEIRHNKQGKFNKFIGNNNKMSKKIVKLCYHFASFYCFGMFAPQNFVISICSWKRLCFTQINR